MIKKTMGSSGSASTGSQKEPDVCVHGWCLYGPMHVTSRVDDIDVEPTVPPTVAQRYCSRMYGSRLMPGG